MIINADSEAVVRTQELTLDDLYRELGTALLGSGMGVGASDPDEARRFGANWLNQRSNELIRIICTSDARDAIRGGGLDDVAAAAAIMYAAYPDVGTVALIAAIVCRRGLSTVCAAYDS